ncbi:MAG: hypothetical protein ACP5PW_04895, partial [Candidatus Dormibacteria bacterium]
MSEYRDVGAGRRRRGYLLVLVALLGAADVAELMVSDPSLMAGSPTRALGSAVGLALFLALAALGARSVRHPGAELVRRWLAAVLAAGSVSATLCDSERGVAERPGAEVATRDDRG